NGMALASDSRVMWSSSASGSFANATTGDVGIGRNAAGLLEVNSTTAGTFRDIVARTYYGDTAVTGTLALVSTSGVGTTDKITMGVGSNGATVMVIANSAGVGVGSIAPDLKFTVNSNTAASTAPDITTQAHLIGADSGQSGPYVDAYAASPSLTGRRANGTQASKTASVADDNLLNIRAAGYEGTTPAYTGSKASIRLNAAETFTSTANGTYINFLTTPTGSTTLTEVARIGANGSFAVNTNAGAAAGYSFYVAAGTSVLGGR